MFGGLSDEERLAPGLHVEDLPALHVAVDDPMVAPVPELGFLEPPVEYTPTGRRRRRDVGRCASGAAWIGDPSAAKIVYGYQHHVGVLTPDPDRSVLVPSLAVFCATGPANANPAAMSIGPTVAYDSYRRRRVGAGLVEVLADGGYTQLNAFVDELREMEVGVTFRLHGGNQEGVRGSAHGGAVFIVDGRPHCSCVPDKTLKFPWRPQLDKADYLAAAAWRSQWELTAMQSTRAGSTRFRSPHHGTGCVHCAAKRPEDRCCTQRTYTLKSPLLRLFQKERHGSPEWMGSYARRSRVEGFFGTLKSKEGPNVCRATARFHDFGKIALATLLRTVAANFYRLDSFQTSLDSGVVVHDNWRVGLLSDHMPASGPVTAPEPSAAGKRKPPRRGPPGLAHLATDP